MSLTLFLVSQAELVLGRADSIPASDIPSRVDLPALKDVVSFAHQFTGIRYRYGGCSPDGFDCSGFIGYVFDHFDIPLYRSSAAMRSQGETVTWEEIQSGDFVFFRGRNSQSSHTGHVAWVTEVKGENVHIIHATRRGVVEENLSKSAYYLPRVLEVRRIVSFRVEKETALIPSRQDEIDHLRGR